jgi:putative heme iron utilization protein
MWQGNPRHTLTLSAMMGESQSNQKLARGLLAAGGVATLATLTAEGAPFASYVVTAPAIDGLPLMLLSRLAQHTKNLDRDPRASLLFVREAVPGDETLTASRLTLTGRCITESDPSARQRYLDRHPGSVRYAEFSDFSLYRFEVESGHLVAGFGRIVSLTREELGIAQR